MKAAKTIGGTVLLSSYLGRGELVKRREAMKEEWAEGRTAGRRASCYVSLSVIFCLLAYSWCLYVVLLSVFSLVCSMATHVP
jgi:hypothetical protein